MIDFPASPTDGQIFSATNGVVYKWNAAYTSWLAQNAAPPLGGTGDFCASQTTGLPVLATGSITTLIPTPVITGNSGVWYNATTGRYTPPAGRYCIFATIEGTPTAASHLQVYLRKNGTTLQIGSDTCPANGQYAQPSVSLLLDANGSDYFDIAGFSSSAPCTLGAIVFQSFPLTGMQGPTGGAPGPVVGDFTAAHSAAVAMPQTTSLYIPNTIVTGNSGSYYNTTTGRYTPPAGRYLIGAGIYGLSTTAQTQITVNIRKNGVAVFSAYDCSVGANAGTQAVVSGLVDANGSDYFEVWGSTSAASGAVGTASFYATPTQGMVGPQGPMGPIGGTQTVFFETGAMATGTTPIPFDDTIPQITEGDQYMSLAITPLSATSKLVIDVVFVCSNSVANHVVVSLHQDVAANALAVTTQSISTAFYMSTISLRHVMTSGTTSATTFRVRAGGAGGTTGTLTFNGQNAARFFGGVMASSIVIREVP